MIARLFQTGLRHRAAVTAVVVKGGGALASFVVTFILARTLGAAETGHYALAISTMTTLSLIGLLGLDQITIRSVAGDLREGARSAARAVIERTGRWTLATGLVCAVAALLLKPLAPRIGLPEAFVWPIVAVALFFPALRIAYAGLRATGRLVVSQLFDGFAYTGLVALLALAVVASGARVSALNFAGAFAAALILSCGVAWLLLWRVIRRWPRGDTPHVAPIVGTGWPIFVTTICHVLTEWTILAQIGATGQQAEVGAFRVAFQIVAILTLLATTVENLAAPGYAGDFRVKDMAGARRRHRRATLGMVAVAGVPVLVCLLFATPLLGLFGPEFATAASALRIMAVAQVINIATGPVGGFMFMSGRERTAMKLALVSLGFAIAIGVFAIPALGATGAALAYAAAIVTRNVVSYWFVRRAYAES